MPPRYSSELINTLKVIGLLALGILILQTLGILVHGSVCNFSSTTVWITLGEIGLQKSVSLVPGQCTDFLTQDAEAIWGRDCSSGPCRHQAWKVGAGRFEIHEEAQSRLRIDGWGPGSRWHISDSWTKPPLTSLSYSLIR